VLIRNPLSSSFSVRKTRTVKGLASLLLPLSLSRKAALASNNLPTFTIRAHSCLSARGSQRTIVKEPKFKHNSRGYAYKADGTEPYWRWWLRNDVTSPQWWVTSAQLIVFGFAVITVVELWEAFNYVYLDPTQFYSFDLVSKETISPDTEIVTLRPSNPAGNKEWNDESWRRGIWTVDFNAPELQITCPYTPLPPLIPSRRVAEEFYHDANDLRFLIRRVESDELSNYVHNLPIKSIIELRGPNPEIDLPRTIDSVVFLAGGTGIAVALQVIHSLLIREQEDQNPPAIKPSVRILWACRKREDCLGGTNIEDEPRQEIVEASSTGLRETDGSGSAKKGLIVQQLESLKAQFPGRLSVEYYVDEERSFISKKDIINAVRDTATNHIVVQREDEELAPDLDEEMIRSDKKLLLISGPDGFNNWLGGPKQISSTTDTQGEIGGEVGKLQRSGILRDWVVRKLE
jgi:cytochrome-b5 reductase